MESDCHLPSKLRCGMGGYPNRRCVYHQRIQPPTARLLVDTIPAFDSPCIYAGDFNCRSTTWGYTSTNPDGVALEDWASASGVQLLFDPKQPDSFHSGRWNTTSNPDLAFANLNGPSPHRTILDPFPRSQHRPSLITPDNQSNQYLPNQ